MAEPSVLCPSCGLRLAADAPECWRCDTPMPRRTAVGAGTPRRSSARRLVRPVAVVLSVALLAGLAVVSNRRVETIPSSQATTTAPPAATTTTAGLGEPTGTSLVLLPAAAGRQLMRFDVDAGSSQDFGRPPAPAPETWGQGMQGASLIGRGDRVVYFGADGEALSIRSNLRNSGVRLGPAVAMAPSVAEDRVWLATTPPTGPAVVREVTTLGRVTTAPMPLPVDRVPLAGLQGGLLLRHGSQVELWQPGSPQPRPLFVGDGVVLAAQGHTVVWTLLCDSPLCGLHLLDTRTGEERVVHPRLRSSYGHGTGAAIAPDGRTLALAGPAPGAGTEGTTRQVVELVDLDSGASRAFVDDDIPQPPALAWSPSGGWLFFAPLEHGPGGEFAALRAGDTDVKALDVPSIVTVNALVAL